MTVENTCDQSTEFASAERSAELSIHRGHELISNTWMLTAVMEAVPGLMAILDGNRQIVAANQRLIDAVNVGDIGEILGARPGEAIQCCHVAEAPGGCGTGRACRDCGAVGAILASMSRAHSVTRECQIRQSDGHPLDLRVSAAPLTIADTTFVVCTFEDIASEKRRQALERAFYHDVLNIAGGIQGLTMVLVDRDESDDIDEFTGMLEGLAEQLVGEIEMQRDITRAEENRLEVEFESVATSDLLDKLAALYSGHDVGRGRRIVVDRNSEDLVVMTGRVLLFRVLGNMVKNALEAEAPGATVTIGCRSEGPEHIRFFVRNPSTMPKKAQVQIFKRTFSTKGVGRGLGTYSMKLLGEGSLGGDVNFVSSEEGTEFYISIPRDPE